MKKVRIIIYDGDENWVEKTLAQSLKNGKFKIFGKNSITVKEFSIKKLPAIILSLISDLPIIDVSDGTNHSDLHNDSSIKKTYKFGETHSEN